MKREELEQWLVNRGYTQNKWRHYQKTFSDGKTYRYKMQAISVRKEIKTNICGRNEWLHVGGGYYKDLHINPKGLLTQISKVGYN